jgi:hypothetical protein
MRCMRSRRLPAFAEKLNAVARVGHLRCREAKLLAMR